MNCLKKSRFVSLSIWALLTSVNAYATDSPVFIREAEIPLINCLSIADLTVRKASLKVDQTKFIQSEFEASRLGHSSAYLLPESRDSSIKVIEVLPYGQLRFYTENRYYFGSVLEMLNREILSPQYRSEKAIDEAYAVLLNWKGNVLLKAGFQRDRNRSDLFFYHSETPGNSRIVQILEQGKFRLYRDIPKREISHLPDSFQLKRDRSGEVIFLDDLGSVKIELSDYGIINGPRNFIRELKDPVTLEDFGDFKKWPQLFSKPLEELSLIRSSPQDNILENLHWSSKDSVMDHYNYATQSLKQLKPLNVSAKRIAVVLQMASRIWHGGNKETRIFSFEGKRFQIKGTPFAELKDNLGMTKGSSVFRAATADVLMTLTSLQSGQAIEFLDEITPLDMILYHHFGYHYTSWIFGGGDKFLDPEYMASTFGWVPRK